MGFFLHTPALWQRKEKAEQVKSNVITFVCAVGNATSVASKQRGRKSENRGAEDIEAENR